MNQSQSMIKDIFLSFKDNLQEKTSNPFLGTYLLVWSVRNWELVYTLLNFDEDQKLQHKIAFIKHYYEQYDFIANLANNTLWTFFILITTYLLLNLSRLIVNFSEKQLTPWVYKITDSESIVLKEVYNKLKEEKRDLEERLEKEREAKSNLDTKIKKLEDENTELRTSIIQEKNTEVLEEPTEVPPPIKVSTILKEKTVDIIFEKLKEQDLLKDFNEIATKIKNKETIDSNQIKPKNSFLLLDLIKLEGSDLKGRKFYSLTEDGEKLLRKINLEYNL